MEDGITRKMGKRKKIRQNPILMKKKKRIKTQEELAYFLPANLPFGMGGCMEGKLNIRPVEILSYIGRITRIISSSRYSHSPKPITIHLQIQQFLMFFDQKMMYNFIETENFVSK